MWPHTSGRPEASNLNIDELQSLAGPVRALPNLVTVPVGADGVVDVYASGGGNVIVDLLGYYTPADDGDAPAGSSRCPRPTRVLDTRGVATVPRRARPATFTVPGAAGASAVAVNLTAITAQPGLLAGCTRRGRRRRRPRTSTHRPGIFAIAANQAIVTVDAGGGITIYSESRRRPAHRPRRHVHRRRLRPPTPTDCSCR